QLGDDQAGLVPAAGNERRLKLRPVPPTSALHLGELGDRRNAVEMGEHGRTLRFESEAGLALLVRAHAIIGDEPGHGQPALALRYSGRSAMTRLPMARLRLSRSAYAAVSGTVPSAH